MARKKKDTRGKEKAATLAEYRFKIEAYSRETMPLARLTEYLRELAQIFGDTSGIHLVGVETGSHVSVLKINHEAIPKLQERAQAVARGDAPRDSSVAYKKVNQMLREDNGRAVLRRGSRGASILYFPGREEAQDAYHSIKQFGALEGIVVRVGGIDETVPIWLKAEDIVITHCNANRQTAKEIATRLFEPVRLMGLGVWGRDKEGDWYLSNFRVDDYQWLDAAPLSDTVAKLRLIETDLDDNAYEDVLRLRQDSGE